MTATIGDAATNPEKMLRNKSQIYRKTLQTTDLRHKSNIFLFYDSFTTFSPDNHINTYRLNSLIISLFTCNMKTLLVVIYLSIGVNTTPTIPTNQNIETTDICQPDSDHFLIHGCDSSNKDKRTNRMPKASIL